MTPINLTIALTDHLQKLLDAYSTEQPSGTFPVKVIPGRFPNPEGASESRSAVYVIVRKIIDEGGNKKSTAFVEMVVSIYDEDNETGWYSLYNVAEHIRQYLLKNRIINKKFILKVDLENPVQTEFVEEQPYPQWIATIVAAYSIGQAEEEGIFYGR